MTKRTRYFLVGAVAFLTIGLAAGLVAYFGGIPGAMAQAGPDELQYVPADAVVVAYADVDDLMNSQFRHAVRDIEPGQPRGQDEFREATGINIETDVDYVLACLLPGDATTPDTNKSGFVLAKGRFDQGRIESFIESKGAQAQTYGGKKIYTGPARDTVSDENERHDHFDGALAFVEQDLVAFGSPSAVKRAIDLRRGGETIRANSELFKMIKGVDQGNAWAVGRFDFLTRNAKLPQELTDRIPPITWFSASGHVNGGVSGRLSVEARDAAAADNLRQVVNGLMALARLQAGSTAKQEEMTAMLNSIRLEPGDGNTVAVSFAMPAEALEILKRHTR